MSALKEFAAFVGIDWADEKHAVCLIESDGRRTEQNVIEQQAEALDEWIADLFKRFGGRPVAVCLEQSRGALAYALMKYECLVWFPVNPKQLAKYREAMKPSGSKDDPSDAELLCEFLRQHFTHMRAWQPDDEITRGLRLLSEERRRWVQQRTAIGNRLIRHLKEGYLLAWELCGARVHSDWFLALLAKFPTQRELQRASPSQLLRYLPKQRRAVDDPVAGTDSDTRIAAIRSARPLVTDQALLRAARLAVQQLVALLRQLNETIAEYDREIAKLVAQHPDAELFAGLPGAGEALTPRLIAAFGSDRTRYASAQEIQQFSGIAPVTVRSGKSHQVRMRRACPKYLRQTFHEFARCSLTASAWARAYLAMQRKKGFGFQAAIRALAFKWQRIMFRCWQSHQPYDEARYLQQLREKQSPIVAYLAPATEPAA